MTLSAAGTTDAETPDDLDYSWDFGNGGTTKDADGKIVTHTLQRQRHLHGHRHRHRPAGAVRHGDRHGHRDGHRRRCRDRPTPLKARIKLKSKKPVITRKVRLSARKSTGTGPLTYSWNFHNGGKRVDATTKRVKIKYQKPGRKKVTLVVTDSTGQTGQEDPELPGAGEAADQPGTRAYRLDGLERLFWPW